MARSILLAAFWTSLLTFMTPDAAAWTEEDVTIEKILAAWRHRQESIRSFQFECDVEVLRPKTSADTGVSHDSYLLSVSGEKMAFCKKSESRDVEANSKKTFRWKSVFDGTCGKSLVEGAPVALAKVSSGEQARYLLRRNLELFPFWYVHSTVSQLALVGYDPKKIRISQIKSRYDGRVCIELTVVPSDKLPRPPAGVSVPCFRYKILVDPARGFLPVRIRELQDGSVVYEASISYLPDDGAGWVASEFRASQFTVETSDPWQSWRVKVKRFSINQPLDDGLFAMEFPVDTHIVEGDNVFSLVIGPDDRQFFIQLPDGKRRRISKDEYGVIP